MLCNCMSVMWVGSVSSKEALTITTHLDPNLQDTDSTYQLISVVEHIGDTLAGGHYVAHVQRDRRWWRVSDTVCEPTSVEQVLTQQAYLVRVHECVHGVSERAVVLSGQC
jgi:ubiquitin C-terminal hydrolase